MNRLQFSTTLSATALCLWALSWIEPAGLAPSEGPLDEDEAPGIYDPLARARSSAGTVSNLEAAIPPQCYTRTGGTSNSCWTCHTVGTAPNHQSDWDLQLEYAFSDVALTNGWTNLFVDRSEALGDTTDEEILRWIQTDNYGPLRNALQDRGDVLGWRPDLDFDLGFDAEGFAVDGSGWRALRYKPFPGTFWPTNGSSDDVFVRLPMRFRTQGGEPSRLVERANLTLLEAALTAGPDVRDPSEVSRRIEPTDERALDVDLDGNGRVEGIVTRIVGLPPHYFGDASQDAVRLRLHPRGTEYLHSVRYVDPEAGDLRGARMKELRYSKKVQELDEWGLLYAIEHEVENRDRGKTPAYRGNAEVGLLGDFGWQLQGFIEDEFGRLRLQTDQEHRTCMGCHGAIGVTVDQTFSMTRKVPGAEGWRTQDLRGIPDVPQAGHAEPEVLTYMRRVGGADEFRSNFEMLERYFPDGKLDESAVRRAAVGGDLDLAGLLSPSRTRALDLARAYRAIVLEQSFDRGRDAVLGPIVNVHGSIESVETENSKTGWVFRDGTLFLDWSGVVPEEGRVTGDAGVEDSGGPVR